MTEREMMQHWVNTWKEAGPELELIRLREVRDADNRFALQQLAPFFNQATSSEPPRPTSGLIEMQRYFAKLRQ